MLPPSTIAPLWMMLSSFAATTAAVIIGPLTTQLHPYQIICLSYATALLWYPPFLLKSGTLLRTARWRLYAARIVLETTGFTCIVLALTMIDLPTYSAMTFVTPLLLALLAAFFLKEATNWHIWIAFASGVAGVLLITRPGIEAFNIGSLYMLTASGCFSICGILVKRLTQTDPPLRISFHMVWGTALFSSPLAISHWQWPTEMQWLALMGIGLSFFTQQYAVTRAFQLAPLTRILPFSFVSLVFASIFEYLLHDRIVSIWTFAGGLCILSGAVYAFSIRKERIA